jgi:hypothetical protein
VSSVCLEISISAFLFVCSSVHLSVSYFPANTESRELTFGTMPVGI